MGQKRPGKNWSPVCWRQLKMWVYQETSVAKRGLVVECGCRQCNQGKAGCWKNWKKGEEGQAPRQTCCLSDKIPGITRNLQGPFTWQHWPFPPCQPNEMWSPGCPRGKTCLQWCWRVVPGRQGQASCLERTLWAPLKCSTGTHTLSQKSTHWKPHHHHIPF